MIDLFTQEREKYFDSAEPTIKKYETVKRPNDELLWRYLKSLRAMRALQDEYEENFELRNDQTVAHYQRREKIDKDIRDIETKLNIIK